MFLADCQAMHKKLHLPLAYYVDSQCLNLSVYTQVTQTLLMSTTLEEELFSWLSEKCMYYSSLIDLTFPQGKNSTQKYVGPQLIALGLNPNK